MKTPDAADCLVPEPPEVQRLPRSKGENFVSSIFITIPPHSMSYRLQSGAACDQKLATQASRG